MTTGALNVSETHRAIRSTSSSPWNAPVQMANSSPPSLAIVAPASPAPPSRAATSLTDEQLVELRKIHESFETATDPEAQAHWNHEFHRLINRAGGSRRLVSVLALLSRSLPVRYFEFVPNWAESSARHHARILTALEERDAHEAQRIMEHHVAESGDLAVGILQEMGYWERADEDSEAQGSASGAA